MASERFANLASTTLASSYTAGAGSISVTSAALFPSAGVFRVALGNASKTILKVTAVSGTTFTVTAEEFDADASSGATVTLVGTKAVAERFLQSPEAGEIYAPSGAAGVDKYGPLYKLGRPGDQSWSWVNQGGATVTDLDGAILLTGVNDSSRNQRLRVKSAPTAPYKVTVLLGFDIINNNGSSVFDYGGICFRESSTSKLVQMELLVGTSNRVESDKMTNETTFSAELTHEDKAFLHGMSVLWFRMEDDNTDLKFYWSVDGKTWRALGSVGRTAFTTGAPNQVGFFIAAVGSPGVGKMTVLGWQEA